MAAAMTKSVVALSKAAMGTAKETLPPYSHRNSPHKFTQAQLFAILCVRRFLGLDLRATVQLLADWSDLRRALHLKQIPHYSTLCYAERRLLKKGLLSGSWTKLSKPLCACA
jgi:hypothetical protein